MNKFVSIEEAISFKKVTYYSIKFEDEEKTEFEKFILKHGKDKKIHDEYQDIMSLIKRIGDKIGAKERYFSRKEKRAEALPPKWDQLFALERERHVKYQHNLRLYCMRISDEIVFLFNGGVKTSGPITAQECENVRKYFYNANKLAKEIQNAIREKDIKIHGMKLAFDQGFELTIY